MLIYELYTEREQKKKRRTIRIGFIVKSLMAVDQWWTTMVMEWRIFRLTCRADGLPLLLLEVEAEEGELKGDDGNVKS